MTQQLRSFLSGSKPGLLVEAAALRDNLPYYWCGQPQALPRRRTVLLLWLLSLALAVHLAWHHLPAAFFLVPIAMALLGPLLYAYDWYETEYLVGPRTCLVKPGLFQRGIQAEATLDFTACRIQQGRFLQRWTGCCNLVLIPPEPEGQPPKAPLVLRDLNLHEAGLLLDALQNNDPAANPEALVDLHRARHRAHPAL